MSLVIPAENYQSLQLMGALAGVRNQRLEFMLSLLRRLNGLSWCQASSGIPRGADV